MEHLADILETGKRRGYEELREINELRYLFQYAIKKENENYVTYKMCIEENKMDHFEDYATEEINLFKDLNSALEFLQLHGADTRKFSSIKKTLPF